MQTGKLVIHWLGGVDLDIRSAVWSDVGLLVGWLVGEVDIS